VDLIRQAIELARADGGRPGRDESFSGTREDAGFGASDTQIGEVRLDPIHLEATRIVAHATNSQHGRYFDMLRTQVLQELDKNSYQFLALTSPTAGCGKSVTACNLALSIARHSERSVVLVDLDLHKPRISEYLGLNRDWGVLSILEGRATLSDALVKACIGPSKMLVLPGEACSSGSSEWMASQPMASLLQAIKSKFRSRIVIFDLPPVLVTDDVISILPQMDAALLIAGVGTTSVSHIKECQKHLTGTPVVRVVVNKITDPSESYNSYY
jgi:protein-tyrosine kinase